MNLQWHHTLIIKCQNCLQQQHWWQILFRRLKNSWTFRKIVTPSRMITYRTNSTWSSRIPQIQSDLQSPFSARVTTSCWGTHSGREAFCLRKVNIFDFKNAPISNSPGIFFLELFALSSNPKINREDFDSVYPLFETYLSFLVRLDLIENSAHQLPANLERFIFRRSIFKISHLKIIRRMPLARSDSD